MTSTEQMIAKMLIENTGRHFLDSGGAYGRSWERNRQIVGDSDPVEVFESALPAIIDKWCGPTLHIYHYLKTHTDGYNEDVDRFYRMWCYIGPDNRYLNSWETIDEFIDACKARGWVDSRQDWQGGSNTYNYDNLLSQDFMWYFANFTSISPFGERSIVFVSIHGGCDARGGYTDFRAFDVSDYDGCAHFISFDDCTVTYNCPDCGDLWVDKRSTDWSDPDGCSIDVQPDGWEQPMCPNCGRTDGVTNAAHINEY